MTSREFDCLVIGFSVGALLFLWVGYRLRVRVERWHARRAGKARKETLRRSSRTIPFDGSNLPVFSEQSARQVLSRPRVIPLRRTSPAIQEHEADGFPLHFARDPMSKVDPIPLPCAPLHHDHDDLCWSDLRSETNATAQAIREDALAALTCAGYKRAAASAALDACSLAERAGGLESWVAAAFRHLVSQK